MHKQDVILKQHGLTRYQLVTLASVYAKRMPVCSRRESVSIHKTMAAMAVLHERGLVVLNGDIIKRVPAGLAYWIGIAVELELPL